MPSISTQKPHPWTCLSLLFAVLISCENSGGTGDAGYLNSTNPEGGDGTGTDGDGDGNGEGHEGEQGKEYCGPLDESLDTSKEQFASQLCCLCENCNLIPEKRWSTYVDSNQTTCIDIDMNTSKAQPGSEACFETQRDYREICCNTECTPPQIEQDWEPVGLDFPQGDQPYCDLCKNGQYPLLPYTITAIAYVPGNPTCRDLYWMGRTKNIPGTMCYPLQNFMEEPCGCTPPAPEERPRGDEPLCDICPDGQYPLRDSAIPNEIDVPGNTSCVDLYWMGRTGNISAKRCEQVHEKAQDACGCVAVE